MAKEHSVDISAKIDMQNFKDAILQASREVGNRFDFKGVTCDIDYNEKAKTLTLTTSSDNKLEALQDIVIGRLLKHDLSSKVLDEAKVENSSGGNRRIVYKIVDYIESKEAKKIVAEIKNMKIKGSAVLEGDHIRVKSKEIDELQRVIRTIRSMEWDAPLVFENMR
ncbi:YajQ family cyclic di-GMP-binding protein [bacterium]|jgi:uncharacterized protein YajQ (UPF0234 family)|nr:YajQ family cyclic di-GMP-binding protein [bacterium]